MLNVFSKGRRKSYDCFAIEVPLKNRTLWGYRSTYPYGQRKGVPPPPGICRTSGHWIFVAKILGIFQCNDFFKEISKLPTNKDLAFVTVPFSLMLRCHLRRHFCETLHVLRSDKQTCGHDLKVSGKKASKYKSEGNFSHIKKLLVACESGLIGVTKWQRFRDFPLRVN